ncbi:NPCBM/NEW2 domain-containing protein [Streptomyces sp. NPDC055078]
MPPKTTPPAPPAPKPAAPPDRPTPPPAPAPTPPAPKPTPPPPPPPPEPKVYQVNRLKYGVIGDGTGPEVRLRDSSWLWQRSSMRIDGQRYAYGVTVHARSSITIDLNRQCSRYDALVGIDDMTLGLGAVRFSVYADGARLWRSPVIRGRDAAVPVSVSLAGRETIRLVVEPHKPFSTVALANWAQSRISCV